MDKNAAMMALAQRALSHFIQGSTDSADDVMTLEVDAYINPQRYQAERQQIFKRLPLALALSLELPQPGCVKAVTVIDTPVLITRDENEQVHAFVNACRHRGARLCDDGASRCSAFTCPYHAWRYNLNGDLISRYGAKRISPMKDAQTAGFDHIKAVVPL